MYNYSLYCDSFLSYLQMKKINLAITGCMGRMGQQIIKSAKLNKNFKLVTLTESRKIKKKINGIELNINTEQAFKKASRTLFIFLYLIQNILIGLKNP